MLLGVLQFAALGYDLLLVGSESEQFLLLLLALVGMGDFIEDKFLFILALLKPYILNGIIIQHNIFIPHLPRNLLILVVTIPLLLRQLPHYRRFEHHLPILLLPEGLKLQLHLLLVYLAIHPHLKP